MSDNEGRSLERFFFGHYGLVEDPVDLIALDRNPQFNTSSLNYMLRRHRPGIEHGGVKRGDGGLCLFVRANATQQFLFRVVTIGSEALCQNKAAGLYR